MPYPGQILRSFAAPGAATRVGLGWDGKSLLMQEDSTGIHYVNPATGRSLRIIPPTFVRGIAWDGKSLWTGKATAPYQIRQVDPATGRIISEFASPTTGESIGLAWDGRSLWVKDGSEDFIYEVTKTGKVLRRIPSAGASGGTLTWDGAAFWHVRVDTDLIYRIDPANGKVLRSFPAPSTNSYGLAWDGKYLWVLDIGTGLIYQLAV